VIKGFHKYLNTKQDKTEQGEKPNGTRKNRGIEDHIMRENERRHEKKRERESL
jgi:hypothetical protein